MTGDTAGRTAVLAIAGTLICAGAAAHEWLYHQAHQHRSGPSLTIAAVALGAALIGAAVFLNAWQAWQNDLHSRPPSPLQNDK